MNKYRFNLKLEGSGIITCIPQTGRCPFNCADCFFQGGRSYLEPLEENLPHIPTVEMAKGRVVRMNDGNDSNNQRELVEEVASQYDDYYFHTSIPKDLGGFSGPVLLTVNPGDKTDKNFHRLEDVPPNLMGVFLRTNVWNWDGVVIPAVAYYTKRNVPVILVWMAYYETPIPEGYRGYYEKRRRTMNEYVCIKPEMREYMERDGFMHAPLVYSCGHKDTHSCARCGVCLREYYATKERMRDE